MPPPLKKHKKPHKSKKPKANPPKSTLNLQAVRIMAPFITFFLFGAWILGEVLEALGASMVISSSHSLAGREL